MGSGVVLSREERAEVRAFLGLKREPKLGDRGIKELVEKFGSGVGVVRGRGLQIDLVGDLRAEPSLSDLLGGGLVVLPMTSPRYPQALHDLTDPPPLLFLKGRLDLLAGTAVAIVGSRKATEGGRRTAGILAKTLSGAGVRVVSGLALGIDGAAHRGALGGMGGTVAVLGSGLRVVYPSAHRALFRKVGTRGLLLSEFLPDERAFPHNFPKRNRIIAALSKAVVVVEAGGRSGALITVDHGLDLGREILAVPGSLDNPRAVGSNRLLREGARIVTDPHGIVEELREMGIPVPEPAGESSAPEVGALEVPDDLRPLWSVLSGTPRGVEEVAMEVGVSFPIALAGLSVLELGGWADQCPGMRFRRS